MTDPRRNVSLTIHATRAETNLIHAAAAAIGQTASRFALQAAMDRAESVLSARWHRTTTPSPSSDPGEPGSAPKETE